MTLPILVPMQSERYINALKGFGATARLVMPKESVLHMLWEQDQWLEKYVKNRNMEENPVETTSEPDFKN